MRHLPLTIDTLQKYNPIQLSGQLITLNEEVELFSSKEDEGFKPSRRERPSGFQDHPLQPDLGNLPQL